MCREDDLSPYSVFCGKNILWDLVHTLLADDRGSATSKGAAA